MASWRGPVLDATQTKAAQDLLRWLQPTDFRSPGGELMKHVRAYMPGTGDWIRKTSEYTQWMATSEAKTSSPNGCLWIKGVPGSGKSVFSASTISLLEDSYPNTPVLFFFFRQIVQKNHDPANLVRDYAAQLLPYSESLRESLKNIRKEKSSVFDQQAVWDAICTAMDGLDSVYCIADALDEMDDEYFDFINKLKALGSRQPAKIKLLVTSRPIPKLVSVLQEQSITSIQLEPVKISPDIAKYVKKSMGSLVPRLSLETEARVIEALCETANGLFLHARLLMDNLEEGLKTDRITEASLPASLEKLPDSLSALYEEMLREHSARSEVDEQEQARILSCVINSTCPLRVLELGSMLAQMRGETHEVKKHKSLVYASCGRLLEVQADETVSVIHHSFTEFLRDSSRANIRGSFPVLDTEQAHRNLAVACCEYIALIPFCWETCRKEADRYLGEEGEPNRYEVDLEKEYLEWPLAQYATRNWKDHIRALPRDDAVALELLEKYVHPKKLPFDLVDRWSSELSQTSLADIHVAAAQDLAGYVESILKKDASQLNMLDGIGRTPLIIAIDGGNEDSVRILLENKADLRHVDNSGEQAIHHVGRSGNKNITAMLLKAGADPMAETVPRKQSYSCMETGSPQSAVQLICCHQYVEEKLFPDFLPYLLPDQLVLCLSWVHCASHIESILKTGLVDVDAMYEGRTSLFRAASDRNTDAVRVLLQFRADPNKRCYIHGKGYFRVCLNYHSEEERQKYNEAHGPTPMHAWAGYTNSGYGSSDDLLECLNLLLAAGGNIDDACDPMYERERAGTQTLVHLLMDAGQDMVAEKIVELGADVNARRRDGTTAAHISAAVVTDNHLEGVVRLHKLGADLTLKDDAGRTPFLTYLTHSADESLSDETLKIMLTDNRSCHVDNRGQGIFHYIFDLSSHTGDNYESYWKRMPIKLILKLMEYGVDINHRDATGQTGIYNYAYYRHHRGSIEEFQKLMENGLDIHTVDDIGRNVIHGYFSSDSFGGHRYLERTQFWCKLGSDITALDNDGNTVIHTVIANEYACPQIIKSLVELGVDATVRNKQGHTTIALALSRPGHEVDETVAYLEGIGVEPLRLNGQGQSSLHLSLGSLTRQPFEPLLAKHKMMGLSIDHLDNFGLAPLHYALGRGHIGTTLLLNEGARVDLLTPRGLSVLHIAAFAGYYEIDLIADYCKRQGCLESLINLHDKTEEGKTALHYACEAGNAAGVRILLRCGADPNAEDSQGFTPLYSVLKVPTHPTSDDRELDVAIHLLVDPSVSMSKGLPRRYGDRSPDIIQQLVEAGAKVNHKGSVEGVMVTPLDQAIAGEHHHIVVELIRHGASTSNGGNTGPAITTALSKTKEQMDELLQCYNEDLPGRDSAWPWLGFGMRISAILETGHHMAIVKFFEHVLQLSEITSIEASVLYSMDQLVENNQVVLLKLLDQAVRKHLALEEVLPMQKKLLEMACREFDLDIIKLFVEDFQAPLNISPSPLCLLAGGTSRHSATAIRYLIEHGAPVDTRQLDSCETPLEVAVSHDKPNLEIIQMLLDNGADPNAAYSTKHGVSTLSLCRDPDALRLLISAGADARLDVHAGALGSFLRVPRLQDLKGTEMVSALVTAGQDVNYLLDDKVPLLHAASKFDSWSFEAREACCTLLLELGADPYLCLPDGRTVLQTVIEDNELAKPLLLDPNLDIAARGQGGRTILMSACKPYTRSFMADPPPSTVSPEIIAMALDLGVDVSSVDDVGRTALQLAVYTRTAIYRHDMRLDAAYH